MNGAVTRFLVPGLFLLTVLPCQAQNNAVVPASGCPSPTADFLELRDYRVSRIRFETPFDFLHSVRDLLAQAKLRLPQKEGQAFRDSDVTEGTREIENILRENVPAIGLPVNITVSIAYLENCDAQSSPKTLEVVYRVFTSRVPFFFSRVRESQDTQKEDPAEAAGLTRLERVRVLPKAGYDPATKVFAGAEVDVQKLGPVERLMFAAQGSAQSAVGEAAVEGSWSPGRTWLRQLAWRSGYRYSDLPSSDGRLKDSRGVFQLSALLRDLGDGGPMVRAGFALEGGNQGSRFTPASLPRGLLAGADFITVKSYAGISWRGRRQAYSISYGLALGNTGGGFGGGFRKHIGDVAYRAVFLPARHTPHELELRFTVGAIQNLGGLPVAERFFGGNQEENFLRGEAWAIRANPVIRSFSRNSLSRTAPGPATGGDRFAAINLTFAPTVWKRPLVPVELVENKEFHSLLDGQLNSIETTLALEYEARDPAIHRALAMKSELEAVRDALSAINAVFVAAENEDKGSPELEERYLDCSSEIDLMVSQDMETLFGEKRSLAGITLSSLVRPGGALDKLYRCEENLRSLFGLRLEAHVARLKLAQSRVQHVITQVDRARAVGMAKADMKFTRHVLETFLNEINLVSISPVFHFDAAWLGPQPASGGAGVRFGIGGGLRFSLASVARFTVGYSFNPNPKSWEKRGAVFLSLDIADLFY